MCSLLCPSAASAHIRRNLENLVLEDANAREAIARKYPSLVPRSYIPAIIDGKHNY
ncbi:hypothetical protein [Gloeocapsopsis sp. IPPAS B-1203]|uniref:hypothetical protein n=1 Tax=Gloeocapsopsis sp. IPPAS B-1203 TaxID=2049454 RepID=UPI0025A28846|nr:hypothetical protein [Gloeocapsopsis sp. IPPAS B-1203]